MCKEHNSEAHFFPLTSTMSGNDLAKAFSAMAVTPDASPRAAADQQSAPHALYESLVNRYVAAGKTHKGVFQVLDNLCMLINKAFPVILRGTPEHAATMRVFRAMGACPENGLLKTAHDVCAADPENPSVDRVLDNVRATAHSFTNLEMTKHAIAIQAAADRGEQPMPLALAAYAELGVLRAIWKRALPDATAEREAVYALQAAVTMHGSDEDKATCKLMTDLRAYRVCTVAGLPIATDPFFFD